MLPIVEQALPHAGRIAIADGQGEHTYDELLAASARVASGLLGRERPGSQALGPRSDLAGARVALLVPSGFEYAAVQWGIWRAGGIAVPLCVSHPLPEIEHVLRDAGAEALIVHPLFERELTPLCGRDDLRCLRTEQLLGTEAAVLPCVRTERCAMILYTSGTTSLPKGVVTTHAGLAAQIRTLVEAWEWSPEDRILHVLPLHHTHGIVNALLCALWAGATCEMLAEFDAERVWERLGRGGITLFMAVPTIYLRLIAAWEAAPAEERRKRSEACRGVRLMVSGSAALPADVFERWRAISGHALLERYGMTEIGMALSNPLRGERRPGFVGTPLPGVEVRLVDDAGRPVHAEGVPGTIEVRGPMVFREYWGRPEATRESFHDGWFRTGDEAVVEGGYYRILGRTSVDIIKSGGYKVSALEVESVLRTHPEIADCAVVGVSDPEWGERVCVAAVLRPGGTLELPELRAWAKMRLAVYKVPSRLLVLADLPRNPMGKVTKPEVKRLFA
ncbi:MAG: acyl-CoA synthetase [Gemmatimonadota bacterium]